MPKRTLFISDLHFDHINILKFEPKRPFSSVEEMNKHIIDKWNSVVQDNDEVIVVGDIALNTTEANIVSYMSAMKGTKILVMGNHDNDPTKIKAYNQVFKERVGALERFGRTIITHIPVHPSQLEHRWEYNIHGHLHSKKVEIHEDVEFDTGIGPMSEIRSRPDPRYLNVSCECVGFTPRTFEELVNLNAST